VIKLNNIVYLNGYIVHFMDYVLVNGLKVIIFIEDIYIYIYEYVHLVFIILNYSEGASPDVIE